MKCKKLFSSIVTFTLLILILISGFYAAYQSACFSTVNGRFLSPEDDAVFSGENVRFEVVSTQIEIRDYSRNTRSEVSGCPYRTGKSLFFALIVQLFSLTYYQSFCLYVLKLQKFSTHKLVFRVLRFIHLQDGKKRIGVPSF